ncbi:MAG TPA: hypothetical protein VF944_04430 [Candidatus Bathyarchaeia archaeon]
MRQYIVRLSGSVGVATLEITRQEMDDDHIRAWADRALPNYWPVYYKMHVFRDDDEDNTLVADLTSYVVVRSEP